MAPKFVVRANTGIREVDSCLRDLQVALEKAFATSGTIDHGLLGGLTDDDHSQYALLAGRSGGQTLQGGTGSGEDLTLRGNSNATDGTVAVADTTVSTSKTTGALTVAGGLGVNDDVYVGDGLFFDAGSQDIKIYADTNDLVIQGQSQTTDFLLELAALDNDGTDDVGIQIGALGLFTGANRESLFIGWDSNEQRFEVRSEAGGSGTVRGIEIETQGNNDQLVLRTDGDVQIENSLLGGDGSGESLTLESTAHATKGMITNVDPIELTEQSAPPSVPSGAVRLYAIDANPSSGQVLVYVDEQSSGRYFKIGDIRVVKPTDETKNSDTTLADDANLAVPVEANEKWYCEWHFAVTTNATPDFKFTISGPSTPTNVMLSWQIWENSTNTLVTADHTAGSSYPGTVAVTAATDFIVKVTGVIENGSNSGTIALQWAQNTSDAANTTVQRGSSFIGKRIEDV